MVVATGDFLSLLSGGLFQSTPHRVVNHLYRNRVSLPFFFDPSVSAAVVTPSQWQALGS